jgi:Salmonella virulence plasmid 65kDa B protein
VDRGQANECNRVRNANRYLKRIKYGNRVSRLIQPDLAQAAYLFEVGFDYKLLEQSFADIKIAIQNDFDYRVLQKTNSPIRAAPASRRFSQDHAIGLCAGRYPACGGA